MTQDKLNEGVCRHARTHTHTHTNKDTHTHTHTHTQHTHTHTHAHKHTHTHTHTHTNKDTHTHTQMTRENQAMSAKILVMQDSVTRAHQQSQVYGDTLNPKLNLGLRH